MYKTLKSRYDGTCGRCKGSIKVGQVIIWNPRSRYTAHRWCETPDRMLARDAERASREAESRAWLEAMRNVK
jgi:hypothetical protein